MPPSHDVIVVGGGALGTACARELASTGRTVLIVEPGNTPGQAWRAAAGMLAPQIETDANDQLLELALAARNHYRALAPSLAATTGIDIGLWLEGIARVAGTETEAQELRAKVEWQRQQGHDCHWLEPGEVARRWPWLSPTAGALWAPHDGSLDPERLVRALLNDAQRLGAAIVPDRAVGLKRQGGKITGVVGDTTSYPAGEVVLAAGAWSGLLEGLPRPIPVRPIRGQMAALPWPAEIPRAIVYHKDSYLLARGGEAVIGSTMEDAGYRPDVTPEGLARILAATMALSPGLIRAKVRRSWAGLRPVTPDGLPIIGGEPLLEGLWYATGHGRNGILLAGMTGALIRQLVDGETSDWGLEAFAVDRFGSPSEAGEP